MSTLKKIDTALEVAQKLSRIQTRQGFPSDNENLREIKASARKLVGTIEEIKNSYTTSKRLNTKDSQLLTRVHRKANELKTEWTLLMTTIKKDEKRIREGTQRGKLKPLYTSMKDIGFPYRLKEYQGKKKGKAQFRLTGSDDEKDEQYHKVFDFVLHVVNKLRRMQDEERVMTNVELDVVSKNDVVDIILKRGESNLPYFIHKVLQANN